MSIYMSRAELEEISEGLITAYANKFSNRVIQSIDIEHFIKEFLMLRIEYASFAEDDAGRIGFLADGATPLYFKKEHPEVKASASQIPWDTDDGYREMLPVMQSDITLKQRDRTLVIDAKYYAHTTQKQYDVNTLHSGNLY